MNRERATALALALAFLLAIAGILILMDALDQECSFTGASSKSIINGVETVTYTEERTCK